MALDDIKLSVEQNLSKAYEKALDKGATEPAAKNLENLESTIDSIVTGITPEGTLEIRENGKYDVTEYADVDVDVLPLGDLTSDERNVYDMDLSSGSVELTPKYSEGGALSIANDTKIVSATRFYLSGDMYYSSGSGGYPARCSLIFEFTSATAGNGSITFDRISSSTEQGKVAIYFSKIDTDLGSGDPRGHTNLESGYSSYTDKSTHTIKNITPGTHTLHVVVYGPEGFYSNYSLSNLVMPTKTVEADVLSKVIIHKPDSLKPKNIVGGKTVFGIVGAATAAGALLEGTAEAIADDEATKLGIMFSNNSYIRQVNLPNCSIIQSSAFMSCSNLSTITLEACRDIGGYAFKGCTKLTSAVFGSQLSRIQGSAFSDCKLSGELVLSGLTSLGAGVFAYNNLSRFEAPIFADFLYSSMFLQNSRMSQVSLPRVSRIYDTAFKLCYSLESAYFPECTHVSGEAFANCSSMSVVDMPACIYAGSSAFAHCWKLSSVNLPLLSIIGGIYCFNGCSGLSKITLPALSSASNGVFYACTGLTEVDLPLLTTIYPSTFYGDAKLLTVNCPVVKNVGSYAFGYCSGLKSITLPACSTIGSSAFWNCTSLERASFPELSGSIYSNAFLNCSKLSALILTNTTKVPSFATNALYSTPMSDSSFLGYFGSIYVDSTMVDAYKTAYYWSYYSDRITSIENLPTA